MANYMLVDVDKLEGDLKTVADSIRSKAGKTGEMKFPDEFKSVVEGIVLSSGVTVQSKAGSFTTGYNGSATVNCGFKPDIVYIKGEQTNYNGTYFSNSTAMCFAEDSRSNRCTVMFGASTINEISWDATSNGFTVALYVFDFDWESQSASNKTFNYVAIKYT